MLHLLERLLVGEGECEGKVGYLFLRIGEHMTKGDNELIICIDVCNDFGHKSSPFLLLGWHHSVDGLQTLIVKFTLNRIS